MASFFLKINAINSQASLKILKTTKLLVKLRFEPNFSDTNLYNTRIIIPRECAKHMTTG